MTTDNIACTIFSFAGLAMVALAGTVANTHMETLGYGCIAVISFLMAGLSAPCKRPKIRY